MAVIQNFHFRDFVPLGTKVVAHWMGWFGTPGHIDVGYNSADLAVITSQIAKMRTVGISGVNPDWYGPNDVKHLATLRMLAECEQQSMTFFPTLDQGIAKNLTGEAAQSALLAALLYVKQTWAISPFYEKLDGRPIVSFFGDHSKDPFKSIDWVKLHALWPEALFFLQDTIGYTKAGSDGGFLWIKPLANPKDPNLKYLLDNYVPPAGKRVIGSVYPGFDDSKAGWSQNRKMDRRGGLTLLDTCSMIPQGIPLVVVATWNDHDEGTGVELGID
jgi:hypothetical protein